MRLCKAAQGCARCNDHRVEVVPGALTDDDDAVTVALHLVDRDVEIDGYSEGFHSFSKPLKQLRRMYE